MPFTLPCFVASSVYAAGSSLNCYFPGYSCIRWLFRMPIYNLRILFVTEVIYYSLLKCHLYVKYIIKELADPANVVLPYKLFLGNFLV
jgi:hypothetical protein